MVARRWGNLLLKVLGVSEKISLMTYILFLTFLLVRYLAKIIAECSGFFFLKIF
jgi:hypothetical protein